MKTTTVDTSTTSVSIVHRFRVSDLAVAGELTETSLVLPDGLSFDEWDEIGKKLQRMEKSVRWWIGDWLRYGERTYGEMYAQAVEVTGYTYDDVRNMQYVAERVESEERSSNLSWSHHKEVAALEPPARREWLAAAEENDWSTRELREQIKAKQKNVAPTVPTCKKCGEPCRNCKAMALPGRSAPPPDDNRRKQPPLGQTTRVNTSSGSYAPKLADTNVGKHRLLTFPKILWSFRENSLNASCCPAHTGL